MKTKAKSKNNLDERQEQKLLQIESKGFWLTYWLLLIVLAVETVTEFTDIISIEIPSFAGEWIVFMVACVYITINCIKNNIWSRSAKPKTSTNLIISLESGVLVGGILGVVSYLNYGKIIGSICVFVFMALLAGGLCFAALSISAAAYKKKLQKEEAKTDDDTEDDAEK